MSLKQGRKSEIICDEARFSLYWDIKLTRKLTENTECIMNPSDHGEAEMDVKRDAVFNCRTFQELEYSIIYYLQNAAKIL